MAEAAGGLVPALPDEIVLAHVVPRLPWYARPVCRAVSKPWRAWMDKSTKCPDLQVKSRTHQLPLLHGCILIFTYDRCVFLGRGGTPREGQQEEEPGYLLAQQHRRSHPYQIDGRQWRELPPFLRFLPVVLTRGTLIASSGMVYFWSMMERKNFVLKLDLGCGDWTWKKFPVPHHFNENAVHFNGKIYVPEVARVIRRKKQIIGGFVYDMRTDDCQCELMETWIHHRLAVLDKKKSSCASSCQGAQDGLYSFVVSGERSTRSVALELFKYDSCRNSWRTWDSIRVPADTWQGGDIQLATSDCFEPAADRGINILWIDHHSGGIYWFNPSLHERRVALSTSLRGMYLNDIKVIRGALYAMPAPHEEFQDDDAALEEEKYGQDEEDSSDRKNQRLVKRSLMKGTISVGEKTVKWEEVLHVGIFPLHLDEPIQFHKIRDYTVMA